MKKLIILLAALSIMLALQAESPEKVSYQAIIRNTKGELVINQAIGMKISIYFYNKTTPVTSYAETQTPTTNENGVVSIEIGTGKVVTGVFADINWAARPYYLKTEIDPGGKTSYSIMADTQILSVPYALHAKTTSEIPDNSVDSIKIKDGSITSADLAENSVTITKLPAGAKETSYLRGDGKWITPASEKISDFKIPFSSFFPLSSSEPYITSLGRKLNGIEGTLYATVNLPSRFKITFIRFKFIDDDTNDMTFKLIAGGQSSGDLILFEGVSSGASHLVRSVYDGVDHIVNNNAYYYILKVSGNFINKKMGIIDVWIQGYEVLP